mgnify:CR=1 FL=1
MFNWFKKEEEDTLKHFKPEWVPQEEPERSYYSIGPSSKGRVIVQVYYGNISLNREGIDNMIKALEVSKVWLNPKLDVESGKQPDNGCQEEETPV